MDRCSTQSTGRICVEQNLVYCFDGNETHYERCPVTCVLGRCVATAPAPTAFINMDISAIAVAICSVFLIGCILVFIYGYTHPAFPPTDNNAAALPAAHAVAVVTVVEA